MSEIDKLIKWNRDMSGLRHAESKRIKHTATADALEFLQAKLEAAENDTARLAFMEIHGSFGLDSQSGLIGGNGQKRMAATRKNIDAAIASDKE